MPTTNIVAVDLFRQISTVEAADFLGITPRKLEMMRQRGDGPLYVRLSTKCVRYRIKDLVEYQEANLKRSTLEN